MSKMSAVVMDTEEDLFASIFEELTVPRDLKQYDVKVSDEEIRNLGEECFLRWLHYSLKGKQVPVRKSAVPTACEKPETVVEYIAGKTVETTFFPDTPDADDYVLGEVDMEYVRATHVAKIQTLLSQKACGTCPISKTCLDLSIIQSPPDGVWGVWGKHHEKTRRLIQNRYNKLRRAYQSTKTQDMSQEERENYVALAKSMTFAE